jgi:hypothetical protein
MQDRAAGERVPPLDFAPVYIGLGDLDRSFKLLDDAVLCRSAALYQLGVDPIYDCLRGDRRCAALLARLGLA